MKCPIDKTDMEKGSLTGSGNYWTDKQYFIIGVNNLFGIMRKRIIKVSAYLCPKCGKIELTSKNDTNKGGEK